MIIEILIVGCAAGVTDDQSSTSPPPGAAAALGVIVRTRGHIAEHDGIEASDVDPHFQGRGARQNVERGLRLCGLELVFDVNAPVGRDLGRVFVGAQGEGARIEDAANSPMTFDFLGRPRGGNAMATGAGSAAEGAGQGFGTDVTPQPFSGLRQPQHHGALVELDEPGTVAIPRQLGRHHESAVKKESQQHLAVLVRDGWASEPLHQTLHQSLEYRASAAPARGTPGVVQGDPDRRRGAVHGQSRTPIRAEGKGLGGFDAPFPKSGSQVVGIPGMGGMKPQKLAREHPAHTALIEKAAAQITELGFGQTPALSERFAPFADVIVESVVGHTGQAQIDQSASERRGDGQFIEQGRFFPHADLEPIVVAQPGLRVFGGERIVAMPHGQLA